MAITKHLSAVVALAAPAFCSGCWAAKCSVEPSTLPLGDFASVSLDFRIGVGNEPAGSKATLWVYPDQDCATLDGAATVNVNGVFLPRGPSGTQFESGCGCPDAPVFELRGATFPTSGDGVIEVAEGAASFIMRVPHLFARELALHYPQQPLVPGQTGEFMLPLPADAIADVRVQLTRGDIVAGWYEPAQFRGPAWVFAVSPFLEAGQYKLVALWSLRPDAALCDGWCRLEAGILASVDVTVAP